MKTGTLTLRKKDLPHLAGVEAYLQTTASMSSLLGQNTCHFVQQAHNLFQQDFVSPTTLASTTNETVQKSLQEKAFDALAQIKTHTARVAMHLDKTWRDKLFKQLDSLHDITEWEEGDEPLHQDSFSTFIKATLAMKLPTHPGLGLSYGGNLIGAWNRAKNRLVIEFLPKDQVRWVLVEYSDDEEPARYAAQTSVSQLVEDIAKKKFATWLDSESERA